MRTSANGDVRRALERFSFVEGFVRRDAGSGPTYRRTGQLNRFVGFFLIIHCHENPFLQDFPKIGPYVAKCQTHAQCWLDINHGCRPRSTPPNGRSSPELDGQELQGAGAYRVYADSATLDRPLQKIACKVIVCRQ
jgi:hypothetical protein